jgi:hypothetical protein
LKVHAATEYVKEKITKDASSEQPLSKSSTLSKNLKFKERVP